jgi:hypothetical protein
MTQGADMAIRRENEVNRNIDTETAEGHIRLRLDAESGDAEKRATARPADGADDEAEGHLRR